MAASGAAYQRPGGCGLVRPPLPQDRRYLRWSLSPHRADLTFTAGQGRARLVYRVGLKSFKFIDEQSASDVKTARIKKSWIPGVYYTEDNKS